jgi:hypothetical protein
MNLISSLEDRRAVVRAQGKRNRGQRVGRRGIPKEKVDGRGRVKRERNKRIYVRKLWEWKENNRRGKRAGREDMKWEEENCKKEIFEEKKLGNETKVGRGE